MPSIEQCSRCGRGPLSASSDFIYWGITSDGHAICPGCFTPAETIDSADSAILTNSADNELLHGLDPDNDED